MDNDHISGELLKAWQEAYTDVIWIAQEIAKAKAWLIANKHKAPKKNFQRFYNNWLSKAWESHRKTLPSRPTQPQATVQMPVNTQIECSLCMGDGLISRINKKTDEIKTFRCLCRNALNVSRGLPVWDSRFSDEYI